MKTKLTVLMLFAGLFCADAQPWEWSEDQLSYARAGLGAATLDDTIFYSGGRKVSYDFDNTWDMYDIGEDEWSTYETSSTPRFMYATVSAGGKVFGAGGSNYPGWGNFTDVDIYDKETGEWTVEHLTVGRTISGGAVSCGNLVFFAGGHIHTGSGPMDYAKVIDIYNTETETWSLDSLSIGRCFIGAVAVNGKVYFAGGATGEQQVTNVIDIYDMNTGEWSLEYLSEAKAVFTAVAYGDKIYFAGGAKPYAVTSTLIEVYNTATSSWEESMNLQSSRLVTALKVKNSLVFTGWADWMNFSGVGYFGPPNGVVEIYYPETMQWDYSVSNLNPERYAYAWTSYENRAYYGGGWGAGVYSKISILENNYQPPQPQPWEWEEDQLSYGREGLSAATLDDSIFYSPGKNQSGALPTVWDIYDVGDDAWSTHETSSEGRYYIVTVSAGGKVFGAGGNNWPGSNNYPDVDIYDKATGEWTVEFLSQGRIVMGGAVACGNKVFFAGGHMYSPSLYITYTNRVDIYDLETNSWSIDSLSVPRSFIASVAMGSKVYFAGGVTGPQAMTNVIDIYDTNTGLWTVDSLSVPKSFIAAVAYGDRIYFAGGTAPYAVTSTLIEVYNTITGTWEEPMNLQSTRIVLATRVGNSLVFSGTANSVSVGDYISIGPLNGIVEVYYPETGQWDYSVSNLTPARHSYANASYGNKAYFAGGAGSGNTKVDKVNVLENNYLLSPQNLAIQIIGNDVTLNWEQPAFGDVIGYKVYRDGIVIEEGTSELTFTEYGLPEGSYWYGVTAIHPDGESMLCDPVHATIGGFIGKLQGFVRDAISHSSIENAWVSAQDSDFGAVTYTTPFGSHYTLSLPGGTYNISCEANGYQKQTLNDFEIIDGDTKHHTFYLTPQGSVFQETPREESLHSIGIYPNPFQTSASITYSLNIDSYVWISIQKASGQNTIILLDEFQEKGFYQLVLDGSELEPGVYFCILKTDEGLQTMKMIKL